MSAPCNSSNEVGDVLRLSHKARVFWPICSLLFLADCSSKRLIVEEFGALGYGSRTVINGLLRFTLAYNRDAAMGIPLGVFTRFGIALFVCVALAIVYSLYRRTPAWHTWRLVALALICGGAAGNLIDRLRWSHGVVDFIDVGLGAHRFWWVFNVADIGVTLGAALLAISLWREDSVAEPQDEGRLSFRG
jgi:signal peptidase II